MCQAGYEPLLARELAAAGKDVSASGPGWVLAAGSMEGEFAFPHLRLEAPVEVEGGAVNAIAQGLWEFFSESLRGERIETPWPCVFGAAGEEPGLGRRVGSVGAAFRAILEKKLGRLAKLSSDDLPRGVGPARGLFVWFTDFGSALVSREAWRNGQRRMADDPLAPSRSYLKVEEAYGLLGSEPRAGEAVCDLGAAPGGWSYSAAKRGARVVAVDNGALKGGALGHAGIEHRRKDAFEIRPSEGLVYDWLFCDLVEEPHHVLRSIVEPWIRHKGCRRFVVNLKFGRVDPIELLGELRDAGSPLRTLAAGVRVRHLYHDRDEFTLTGEVAA